MFPGSRAARPSPPPRRGRRRTPGRKCGCRAPCGARAGQSAGAREAELGACGLGRGRAGMVPGRAFWASRAGLELEVFYLLFFNGRALPRLSPKGAEAFLGDGGSRQALRACGTTAGRRAAILSPRLLSLWGVGGRALRHRPDGPGRGGSAETRLRGPPPPTRPLGPDGGPPGQRPEALLECRGGRGTGTTEILRASASPARHPHRAAQLLRSLSPSISPFILQAF